MLYSNYSKISIMASESIQSFVFAKIDKLMFIATKADHITLEQFPNLVSLMRQLVQEGGRYVEYEGIDTEYTAISAIRSTQQVQVTQNGQKIKALQGIRSI